MKKIGVLLLTFMICLSSFVCVSAKDSFSFTLDTDTIKCGYTDIYQDGTELPSTPPTSMIDIHFASETNKEYKFYLVDAYGEKVIGTVIEGTTTNIQTNIEFPIAGTLKSGYYSVVGEFDNETFSKNIKILNNLALDSKVSTESQGNGRNISAIVDGHQWNWLCQTRPTSTEPFEVVFDYGADIVELSSISFFTNMGLTHGPDAGYFMYKDIDTGDWKKITVKSCNNTYAKEMKNINSDTFKFPWTIQWENGISWELEHTSEPLHFEFDKPVKTNSLKFVITETNSEWGNHSVISEVQTWGCKVDETYSLDIGENYGYNDVENVVHISSRYQVSNDDVTLELLDSNYKPLDPRVSYQTSFVGGKLEYDFVVPKGLEIGSYYIHVKSENIDDKSLEYKLIENNYSYLKDITSHFHAVSETKTIDGSLENICDQNIETYWEAKPVKGLISMNLETSLKNGQVTNAISKKIKVYAKKSNIASITVKAGANKSAGQSGILKTSFKPAWKQDDKGTYFVIDLPYLVLTYEYSLEFTVDNSLKIYDVELSGIYFENNSLNETMLYVDDELHQNPAMFDNDIGSYCINTKDQWGDLLEGNSGNKTLTIQFPTKEATIDRLYIAANQQKFQGISKLKIDYYENNEWKTLETFELEYKIDDSNNLLREVGVISLPSITTSKLRLEILEYAKGNETKNGWDKYIISELYASYKEDYSARAIAESLKHLDDIEVGQSEIIVSLFNQEIKDRFTFEVNSSSRQDIIALNGKINHPVQDTEVTVTLKVTDKLKKENAITNEIKVLVRKGVQSNEVYIEPCIDTTSILHNPAMGWVQYIEGFECRLHNSDNKDWKSDLCTVDATDIEEYWKEMDKLYQEGLPTSILYIRMPWSWFEPEQGQYAWEDPNSELSRLIAGAKERNLQLSFRVYINSDSCFEQSTPEWFFGLEGAKYWENNQYQYGKAKKEVYLDDPVFVKAFGEFIKAFGKKYNAEENNVAFIDGMGTGSWGETQSNMKAIGDIKAATLEIIKMYKEAFPDVLLGAQYTGDDRSGGLTAMNDYDYVLRRDNYGVSAWLNQSTLNTIRSMNNDGLAVFAENALHHFDSREGSWVSGDAGTIALAQNRNTMLTKVVNDALYTGANTLDARVLEDCKLWIKNDKDNQSHLLEKFALNCGYRLSLNNIIIPKVITSSQMNITHSWKNNGVGILPNHNSSWNNKYKVAFALIDHQTNKVVYQFNESSDNVNAGDWRMGNNYRYQTNFVLPDNIADGKYKLATAIVNEKLNYSPDIRLAMSEMEITKDGWYVLDDVYVARNECQLTIENDENGKVDVDKKVFKVGDQLNITITPKEGYALDKVIINDKEIPVEGNQIKYFVETPTVCIKPTFKKLTDKEQLQILFDKVKNYDKTQYTLHSWKSLEEILKQVQNILNKNDATQEEIDQMYQNLIRVINGLELKKKDDSIIPDHSHKPVIEPIKVEEEVLGDKVKTDNSPVNHKVKTGDSTLIFPYIFIILSSLGIYMILKKKHI